MSFRFQRLNTLRVILRKFNENHDPATGEFAPAGGLAAGFGSSNLIHDGNGEYVVRDSEGRGIGTVKHNAKGGWTGTHTDNPISSKDTDNPIDAGQHIADAHHKLEGEVYNDQGLDYLLASDEGGQR